MSLADPLTGALAGARGGMADLRDLIEGLDPEELGELLARIEDPLDLALVETVVSDITASGWRSGPLPMAMHLQPGMWEAWAYVELLSRKFVEAATGVSTRQVWMLPPRYGKTWWVRWGLLWALDHFPEKNYILSSYGDTLAHESGVWVRDTLRDYRSQMRTRLVRAEAGRLSTPQGGGLLTAGIDAGISGFPGDGVIVDDPFKNWQEAHSPARRVHVFNQYKSVLRQRLERSDSFMIVATTRWHTDDLPGELLKAAEAGTGEEFEVVRLPEIAEAPDPTSSDPLLRLPDLLGREPGEVLEPRRYDRETVRLNHLSAGSYLAAAIRQQRPSPEEGTEILRAWFRLEEQVPPRPDDSLVSWDMKLKDKEAGDYVVGQLWWRVAGGYWLMDQLRGQWNEATTKCAFALMAVRHPGTRKQVYENTGNAPELVAEMRRAMPGYEVSDHIAGLLGMDEAEREAVQALLRRGLSGLVPKTPKGDKSVRMRAVSPLIEAGDVHLPAAAAWVPHYLDEMAAFGSGSGHDDQVDSTSQALAILSKGTGRTRSYGEELRNTRAGESMPRR